MRWTHYLLSPLFLAMSIVSFLAIQQTPGKIPIQHHATSVTQKHTTKKASVHAMPTPSVPDVPTAASLGLPAHTQQWITLAWKDAYEVEESKNDNRFPIFFVRQIKAESAFEPYDKYGNALGSGAGAIGIAQFEPGTAASHGVNPYDPTSSLLGAAKLMVSYVHQYNNYDMALAAYNAGPGDVSRGTGLAGAIARCGSANFIACLPSETRTYIYEITGD